MAMLNYCLLFYHENFVKTNSLDKELFQNILWYFSIKSEILKSPIWNS